MLNTLRLEVKGKNEVSALSETLSWYRTNVEDLVKRAAGGDVEAFGEIYTLYLNRIYRYVFYQVKDRMLAEDFTEEIFMKSWMAIKTYKGERQSFTTWVYRIAHNYIIDYFRKNKTLASLDRDVFGSTYIVENVTDIELETENHLMREELMKLINCLPLQQKQVVILKFIECLDNREIGQVIGKSQGAIRILQMRALNKLRQQLYKEELCGHAKKN